MKKILTLSAIALFAFAKSQITLEHSFKTIQMPSYDGRYISSFLSVYSDNNDTFYYAYDGNDKAIKMYNSDYTLRKSIPIAVPSGYIMEAYASDADSYGDNFKNFSVTKNIFNSDDNYEFFVSFREDTMPVEHYRYRNLILVNESGNLIYDFGIFTSETNINIFHDNAANKNKLILKNSKGTDNADYERIYSLPSTTLAIQELKTLATNKLYPNPASTEVNIPLNSKQSGVLKVYNTNGQLIKSASVSSQEDYYKLPLNNYPKGMYLYEINGDKGKFIVK